MDEALKQETEHLRRAWRRHDAAMLRDYLVMGVEDPRLNVPSLLTRHFLIGAIGGEHFRALMDHELRFATAMNWLLRQDLSDPADRRVVLHGLRRGADDAEGIAIPSFVSRLFAALPATVNGLPVPNYLEAFLSAGPAAGKPSDARQPDLDVFQRLWQRALAVKTPPDPRPSVLEAACGSANDYRGFAACGLARLIAYTGFDLCEANVQNARAMFPGARFELGNVFAVAAADKSFDYLVAHDLFEHLSLGGLEAAVREVCRVTRRALCLGFFSMAEMPVPIVRPVGDYHWNTLSVDQVSELFAAQGFAAQVIHIGTFLKRAFDCDQTHNPDAYSLVLHAQPEVAERSVPVLAPFHPGAPG